jgi:23S rRNA (guanosine2251-2'-O)-methyltransferase
MLVYSLPDIKIEQLGLHKSTKPIVILDQISDPHNVGAIMRTAAAFNAAAIIIAKNNAPDESANIAKIACGTMEITPIIKVVNITKTMEQIKEYGYWCIGLDGHAKQSISSSNLPDKLALVLGSEGKGIRKLVKQTCDLLVTIPMNPNVESLNVSNAAAISLYEISRNKDPAH